MTRIDHSETSTHCWRTDHNIARIINAAREAGEDKHGLQHMENRILSNDRYLAILAEEFGEVADAINELDLGNVASSMKGLSLIGKELIDVMAVCAAWLDQMKDVAGIEYPSDAWLAS